VSLSVSLSEGDPFVMSHQTGIQGQAPLGKGQHFCSGGEGTTARLAALGSEALAQAFAEVYNSEATRALHVVIENGEPLPPLARAADPHPCVRHDGCVGAEVMELKASIAASGDWREDWDGCVLSVGRCPLAASRALRLAHVGRTLPL
jgi:hypothetical protein